MYCKLEQLIGCLLQSNRDCSVSIHENSYEINGRVGKSKNELEYKAASAKM